FDDELRQGGAILYPAAENQTLSFTDRSNPVSGNSVRYTWNGQNVNGQHGFAGFDLMDVGTLDQYKATPGRDLRAGHYTRVQFDIRGSLSAHTVAKVEVAAKGAPPTATCAV